MWDVKVVADSSNLSTGDRWTTFEATYPRIIHEEVLTHAALSLVTASSRAVPTERWLGALKDDPFIPGFWGAKQGGMQAYEEIDIFAQEKSEQAWLKWISDSADAMQSLSELNVHKQITNRPPHAGTWITSVLGATEWQNFFGLRFSQHAQPEFQCLAAIMYDEYRASKPAILRPGEWHLPYITVEERTGVDPAARVTNWNLALRSTARCGRVSYFRQGEVFSEENERSRALSFIQQGHWSTTEFAGVALPDRERHGNVTGFRPVRKFYENEAIAAFDPPDTLPGRYEDVRRKHWMRKHGSDK